MSLWVIALVFFIGSRWIADLSYSINSFFVVLMSVTFGAIQAGNVFSFVPDISKAQASASGIIHLLDARPEVSLLAFLSLLMFLFRTSVADQNLARGILLPDRCRIDGRPDCSSGLDPRSPPIRERPLQVSDSTWRSRPSKPEPRRSTRSICCSGRWFRLRKVDDDPSGYLADFCFAIVLSSMLTLSSRFSSPPDSTILLLVPLRSTVSHWISLTWQASDRASRSSLRSLRFTLARSERTSVSFVDLLL